MQANIMVSGIVSDKRGIESCTHQGG